MDHPFHFLVGNIIEKNKPKGHFVLRDSACGGDHRLSLYSSEKGDKCPAARFCDVDLLIHNGKTIKAIIEIEESNVKPNHILGKFLASALSAYYEYEFNESERVTYSINDETEFIQILDSSKLKIGRSSKPIQWDNISEAITKMFPIKGSKISKYTIIYGDDFRKRILDCLKRLSP